MFYSRRALPEPPAHLADRRARRKAQLRRRRLAALGALLAVIVATAAVVLAAAGSSSPSPAARAAGRRAARQPQRRAASATATAAASGTAAGTASAATAAIQRLLGLGLPIYCGGPRGNEVAFTFDDGPGVYTHYAIKKLTAAHEGATFFDVGKSIDGWPGFLGREVKLGGVEDHTYTHVPLISLSPSEVTYQLRATAQKIEVATGQHVALWRPPYELYNATVDRIAQGLGLLNVLWDDDSQDSLGANYAQITSNVEAGLRPGAIIEMHENRGQTIRALTALLPALRRHHLRSVSVPQLLASDPPSVAQVRQGISGCKKEGEFFTKGPPE